jgi:hypothetical protein
MHDERMHMQLIVLVHHLQLLELQLLQQLLLSFHFRNVHLDLWLIELVMLLTQNGTGHIAHSSLSQVMAVRWNDRSRWPHNGIVTGTLLLGMTVHACSKGSTCTITA